jgi:hypothetical protein
MKKELALMFSVMLFVFFASIYLVTTVRAQDSYFVTVASDHGSPTPPVGDNQFNFSDLVTCSVSSPVSESGHSYTCTGWTGGSGDISPTGTGTSTSQFSVSQNSSITWLWQLTQWTLTVNSAHGSPSPGVGPNTYNDGDQVTCSVSSPVFGSGHSWTCSGWTGTGSVPSSGSGTSTGQFTMTSDSSITWLWQLTQWTLTVNSAHGSPSPGVGPNTYNDGDQVNCSVTSPVTEGSAIWTCTGWSGTGSVPSSGTTTSILVTMNQNSAITWNWQVFNHTLTVSSLHGSPTPSTGAHTYSDGSQVTCSVTSPVNESGTLWTCTGWSGTGSVPASGTTASVTFTISQNSTITWNWHSSSVQQYQLTIKSAHGDPSPAVGDHLYDDNDSVTCSIVTPVNESGVMYVCTGWTGTGSVPPSGSGASTTFTITENSTITWNWQVQIVAPAESPEYVFGTILGLTGCFAALGVFRIYKRKH